MTVRVVCTGNERHFCLHRLLGTTHHSRLQIKVGRFGCGADAIAEIGADMMTKNMKSANKFFEFRAIIMNEPEVLAAIESSALARARAASGK